MKSLYCYIYDIIYNNNEPFLIEIDLMTYDVEREKMTS